jgi:hypothetical protein
MSLELTLQMPEPEHPTPEAALAEWDAVDRESDLGLINGYRRSTQFLRDLETSGAHVNHITKAHRALSEAFCQVIRMKTAED